MKVLVTGKGGQLAWELEQTQPEGIELLSLGIDELDITSEHSVLSVMSRFQPDVVINAAAYTAVDKAESETELAYEVNALGASYLAKACKREGARLLHVSTDFIFDGTATTPYEPSEQPNPINIYGASKLAGENAVVETLSDQYVIVRTAWVYSAHGNNFVKTMLRLMAEKSELGVVYDQVGSPTWAKGLASWLWTVTTDKTKASGSYHWTDAGVASWYDFAIAIQELALEKGLLLQEIPIRPIPTSAYPTPAKRPAFSVLDKGSAERVSGHSSKHWRRQLSSMLDELKVTPHSQPN